MKFINIIGGGLSGLGLANGLLSEGIPVTVTEAGHYPRHRVCGEFLTSLREDTLEGLGINECFSDSVRHQSTAWYRKGKKIQSYKLPEPAIGISRYTLDKCMASAIRKKGGTVIEGVREPIKPKDGTLFATGRIPTNKGKIGLKGHWGNLQTEEDLELHLGKGAYVGLSAVEEGFVNVCGLFSRVAQGEFPCPVERFYATLKLHDLEHLTGRLKSGKYREMSFCSVTGLDYSRKSKRGIGDHNRQIPPFTGNGMTIALESAQRIMAYAVKYAMEELDWKGFQDKSQWKSVV